MKSPNFTIFHNEDKVNFVDINNVFVGYDLYPDCCEHADWFISKTEDKDAPLENNQIKEGLDDYIFDTKYFVDVELDKDEYGYTCLEDGGMVRFKLIAKDKPDLFLHLYNSQNGYYSHGFQATIGDILWRNGTL
jgi:hypothetical protein